MSTDIEWTDDVWNFLVGCSRVGPPCDHCYAMRRAHRKMSPQHHGLTILRPKDAARPGVDWNGKINVVEAKILDPLRWRKPQRVFVNSMSDLFHHNVPEEILDRAFAVMLATSLRESGITYQILTKRPQRMLEYVTAKDLPRRIQRAARAAGIELLEAVGIGGRVEHVGLQHANIHLGVSCGSQEDVDAMLPILRATPAAVRWMSYEPALGPIELRRNVLAERMLRWYKPMIDILDWIVVGGESGPGARPFDVAWARSVLDQARGSDCKVFVKQLGSRPHSGDEHHGLEPVAGHKRKVWRFDDGDHVHTVLEPSGGNMAEWPADLRVREILAA
jgi:protein gp37